MMGSKKLGEIREELRTALAATGEDPIRWLEERMTTPKNPEPPGRGNEILLALRRVLQTPRRRQQAKKRSPTKK